jgi:hypothetical protein
VAEVLKKAQEGDFPRPRQIDADIAQPLEAVCVKAMALRAEDRYTTPQQLAEDLEHWLADEPVQAWPEPWTVKTRRWTNRHRGLVSSAAACLVVATIALGAGIVLVSQANSELEQANQTIRKKEQETSQANAQLQEKEKEALAAADAERRANQSEAEQRTRAEAAHRRSRELAFLYEELILRQDREITFIPGIADEYRFKAAFLYHFGKLVQWPKNTPAGDSTFVIGILGTDPFGKHLDELARHNVRSKTIVIKKFVSVDEVKPCHILFIGAVGVTNGKAAAEEYLRQVLDVVKDTSVLTVGQMDGFAKMGGHIELKLVDNRVRFAINEYALRRVGLQAHASLLASGDVVKN